MKQYLSNVQEIETFFESVLITRVPRDANTQVGFLARLGSRIAEEIEASDQQVKTLTQPSITPLVNVMLVQAAEFLE
jgi:hypothetical protein